MYPVMFPLNLLRVHAVPPSPKKFLCVTPSPLFLIFKKSLEYTLWEHNCIYLNTSGLKNHNRWCVWQYEHSSKIPARKILQYHLLKSLFFYLDNVVLTWDQPRRYCGSFLARAMAQICRSRYNNENGGKTYIGGTYLTTFYRIFLIFKLWNCIL